MEIWSWTCPVFTDAFKLLGVGSVKMRIIAFITHSADIRQILDHIGAESEPPRIAPARGPPLWEGCDAPEELSVEAWPGWDEAAQPAPHFEVDQRING